MDIGDFFAQTGGAARCVYFHELVLLDHFGEGLEGWFDFGAGGAIVGYGVDEGGEGDAAGVCGCVGFFAGAEVVLVWWFAGGIAVV